MEEEEIKQEPIEEEDHEEGLNKGEEILGRS